MIPLLQEDLARTVSNSIRVNFRLALSALASPAARQSAARWLLAACLVGYIVTLAVMAARGTGPQRWFFPLLAWALFVYLPLRILLETAQTLAPAVRRTLTDEAAQRADRYTARGPLELLVDRFYGRHVVMPRIATPLQGIRARAAAVAVFLRLSRRDAVSLPVVLTRCLAALDVWVHALGIQAAREGSGNIQLRWAGVRAVIALAALTKILLAAAEDRREPPFAADLPPSLADDYLDACLDYCDDLALQVEVVPWTEPPLDLGVPPEIVTAVRERWTQYCEIDPPAVDARTAFVEAVAAP